MATRDIVPRATAEGGIGTTLKRWASGWFNSINDQDVSSGIITQAIAPVVGQCRLTLSGSTLLLSPQDGNKLTIDATMRALPSSGPTLAATGVANTTYYIYAYWTGSAIALEASMTAPAWDTRNTARIKTGDATRSLVGMARTNSSGAWVDSATQRFVLSWFNRRNILLQRYLASDATSTSTTVVEFSSSRLEALFWGDESICFNCTYAASASSTSMYWLGLSFFLNGNLSSGAFLFRTITTDLYIVSFSFNFSPSIGYNTIGVGGSSAVAGTGTFFATNTVFNCMTKG